MTWNMNWFTQMMSGLDYKMKLERMLWHWQIIGGCWSGWREQECVVPFYLQSVQWIFTDIWRKGGNWFPLWFLLFRILSGQDIDQMYGVIAHCQVRNKKIIADSGILVLDALFSTLFRVSVRLQQRKTAVLSLLFPYGLVPIFDASYQTDQAANPHILMARDRLWGILQISWPERS